MHAVRPGSSEYSLIPLQGSQAVAFSTVVLSFGADALALPAAQGSHVVSLMAVPAACVHSPARQIRCSKHTFSSCSAVLVVAPTSRKRPGEQAAQFVSCVVDPLALVHCPAGQVLWSLQTSFSCSTRVVFGASVRKVPSLHCLHTVSFTGVPVASVHSPAWHMVWSTQISACLLYTSPSPRD